jgi:hypothetical protein
MLLAQDDPDAQLFDPLLRRAQRAAPNPLRAPPARDLVRRASAEGGARWQQLRLHGPLGRCARCYAPRGGDAASQPPQVLCGPPRGAETATAREAGGIRRASKAPGRRPGAGSWTLRSSASTSAARPAPSGAPPHPPAAALLHRRRHRRRRRRRRRVCPECLVVGTLRRRRRRTVAQWATRRRRRRRRRRL